MRIGILTQPLNGNFGGILQNYALQTVLSRMGHTPVTIDRHIYRSESLLKNLAKRLVRIIKPVYDIGFLTGAERARINADVYGFVERNIQRTRRLYTQSEFEEAVGTGRFDAFIAGSDQCWRPMYSPSISNYYLDFVADPKVKRIVYAASFGVDTWEYTPAQTEAVVPAARKLHAVSVRESSGVKLCKDNLGIDAQWVLDPTMLLDADDYAAFFDRDDRSFVTTYLLEESPRTDSLVEKVKSAVGVEEVRRNKASAHFRRFQSINANKELSVEQWLANIAGARFLVTDSFHGAVFAILFNVPFCVTLNGVRGNARLHSLLADFGLDRLLCSDPAHFSMPQIDWAAVNKHLALRRSASIDFLKNALQ